MIWWWIMKWKIKKLWFNKLPKRRLQIHELVLNKGKHHNQIILERVRQWTERIKMHLKIKLWRTHQIISPPQIREKVIKINLIRDLNKANFHPPRCLLLLQKQWVEVMQKPWQRKREQLTHFTKTTSSKKNQEELNKIFNKIRFPNS